MKKLIESHGTNRVLFLLPSYGDDMRVMNRAANELKVTNGIPLAPDHFSISSHYFRFLRLPFICPGNNTLPTPEKHFRLAPASLLNPIQTEYRPARIQSKSIEFYVFDRSKIESDEIKSLSLSRSFCFLF